ncbi:hypothetical protein FKM82_030755 [Ascaphus truei]
MGVQRADPKELQQKGNEETTQVVNLSKKILDIHNLQVLTKGLSFCPTTKMDIFETIKDINLFSRRLQYYCIYSLREDNSCLTRILL